MFLKPLYSWGNWGQLPPCLKDQRLGRDWHPASKARITFDHAPINHPPIEIIKQSICGSFCLVASKVCNEDLQHWGTLGVERFVSLRLIRKDVLQSSNKSYQFANIGLSMSSTIYSFSSFLRCIKVSHTFIILENNSLIHSFPLQLFRLKPRSPNHFQNLIIRIAFL